MPSIKEYINYLLIKHVRINNLKLDDYMEQQIDLEANLRASHWRKEKDNFALSCQHLKDIIFQKDKEISTLKSQASGIPTKKEIMDRYLQDQIDSGALSFNTESLEKIIEQSEKPLNLSNKANRWALDVLSGIKEVDN